MDTNRDKLTELTGLLTPDQLDMFRLCFGSADPVDVKQDDIGTAIRLCEATIRDTYQREVV
jgi:hypothetical protein